MAFNGKLKEAQGQPYFLPLPLKYVINKYRFSNCENL
jgi:hypothetical protein